MTRPTDRKNGQDKMEWQRCCGRFRGKQLMPLISMEDALWYRQRLETRVRHWYLRVSGEKKDRSWDESANNLCAWILDKEVF